MSFKVDFLYPFDKGFFGKTLSAWSKSHAGEGIKPYKIEMSSIDDFNKHFADKFFEHRLERTPETDKYTLQLADQFPNIL